MRTINDSHSLSEMPEFEQMLDQYGIGIENSRVDYILEYTDGWEFEYFGHKTVITYFMSRDGKIQRHGRRRCEYSEEYFAEHYAQFEIDETEEAEEETEETTTYMVSAWTEIICTGSANSMSAAEEYRFTDPTEAYKFYEEMVADTPSDYKREVASAGRLAKNKQFCVDLWAGVQDADGYWTADAEGLEYFEYGWAEMQAED